MCCKQWHPLSTLWVKRGMYISSKPLIAAGAGAAIGGIIGTFLVPIPGVGTVLWYATVLHIVTLP